jgi:hypothetical protein
VSTLVWVIPLVIVVLIAAAAGLRGAKIRRDGSVNEEMRKFRRGLDALDPANDPLRRREQQNPRPPDAGR